jgi:surfeit locus 1 family protein
MMRQLLTPRWVITTVLVVAAVAFMVFLGIWQLDRQAQRNAFNEQVSAQIDNEVIDLNQVLQAQTLAPEALNELQYRRVVARGHYRLEEQVALRNQVWEYQPGFHLLTPLYLEGTDYAIMIDRGWIPLDERTPQDWVRYEEAGVIEIEGRIKLAQNNRRFGPPDPTLTPDQTRLDAWNAVNLERIKGQVQGDLLPVYVAAAPQADPQPGPPYRTDEQPDLSAGSHMGYALQWFSFAAILGIGYPFFVRKQLQQK